MITLLISSGERPSERAVHASARDLCRVAKSASEPRTKPSSEPRGRTEEAFWTRESGRTRQPKQARLLMPGIQHPRYTDRGGGGDIRGAVSIHIQHQTFAHLALVILRSSI